MRRQIAAAIYGLSVLAGMPLFGGVVLAKTVPGRVWPQYQYDAQKNAVFDLPKWTASWRVKFGGQINGGLSIVGSTLYVESFDKNLYAIDARSGAVRWISPLSDIAMNTPLVANGMVFVGTGSNAGYSDPAIPGVLIGGRAEGNDISAFSVTDGSLKWSMKTLGSDMPTGAITGPSDRLFIFSNGDRHAYGVSSAGGALLWRTPVLGNDAMAHLAAADELVFGTTGYGMFWPVMQKAYAAQDKQLMAKTGWTWALDPLTGSLRWIAPFGRGLGAPTVGQQTVFVESEQFSSWYGPPEYLLNEIDALDESTGALKWKFLSRAGPFSGKGSGLEDIGGVYLDGTYYDSLPFAKSFVALSASDGHPRWEIPTHDQVKMTPVIVDGDVIFGDVGGTLYIVDARNGKIKHEIAFPGIFTCSSPVVVSNVLYIANGKYLYALELDKLRSGTMPALTEGK